MKIFFCGRDPCFRHLTVLSIQLAETKLTFSGLSFPICETKLSPPAASPTPEERSSSQKVARRQQSVPSLLSVAKADRPGSCLQTAKLGPRATG